MASLLLGFDAGRMVAAVVFLERGA